MPAPAEQPVAAPEPAGHDQRSAPPRRAGPRRLLWRFVLRRVVITAVLLVGVTMVTFTLVQIVPGDSAAANLSDAALDDPEIVAAYRAKWGLDQPLPVQYVTYLSNLVQGDLGTSQQTGRPVATDLRRYVPATLELALPTMVLSLVIGTAIGMTAALRHGRASDQAIRVGSLVGLSTPPFWLAILALYVFFFRLGLLPNGQRLSPRFEPPPLRTGMHTVDAAIAGRWDVVWDAVQHLALPVGVLTVITVSLLVRFVRASVLEVLGEDYIEAAHGKGLPAGVVNRRHVLRAAMVPVITVSGLAFASLLSGTVLVEAIFGWPGMGRYAFQSAEALDLSAILGVSLFVGVVYSLVNLVVDVAYGIIDPRIRLS